MKLFVRTGWYRGDEELVFGKVEEAKPAPPCISCLLNLGVILRGNGLESKAIVSKIVLYDMIDLGEEVLNACVSDVCGLCSVSDVCGFCSSAARWCGRGIC